MFRTGSRRLEIARKHGRPQVSTCLPLCRNTLGLYLHIARLNWRDPGDSSIRGTVSDLRKQDIKDFAFDPGQQSTFDIVQNLWDLL